MKIEAEYIDGTLSVVARSAEGAPREVFVNRGWASGVPPKDGMYWVRRNSSVQRPDVCKISTNPDGARFASVFDGPGFIVQMPRGEAVTGIMDVLWLHDPIVPPHVPIG